MKHYIASFSKEPTEKALEAEDSTKILILCETTYNV